jgi:cytochrome c-type biogenesis protein CcmF
LLIGAIQITSTTSIPVWNKLFGFKTAPPADPIEHYNSWQIPIAVLVSLLIAIGQFLKYKKTESHQFFRKIAPSFFLAVLITIASAFVLGNYKVHYYALFFSSVFAICANIDFIVRVLKGKISHSGASIAHVGIGMILLGALISNSKKEIISQNVKAVNLGKDFPNKENIMIEQKIDTLPMGDYYVTYKGNEQQGVNKIYTIQYFKLNRETGIKEKSFELHPVVQLNERMGNVSEPSTHRFLTRDIYTHITYAAIKDINDPEAADEYQAPKTQELAIGDTCITSNSVVIFEGFSKEVDRAAFGLGDSDIAVSAHLKVEDVNRKIYTAEPVFIIKNFNAFSKTATIDTLGLKFSFDKINPVTGKIELQISEKKSNTHEFIIMKAIVFPGINILWIGCVLMFIGSVIAVRQRIRKLKRGTGATA